MRSTRTSRKKRGEGVAEQRVADLLDPWAVHLDEEKRMGVRVLAAGELGLQDEESGVVGASHVPLLAIDDVAVAVAPRRAGEK